MKPPNRIKTGLSMESRQMRSLTNGSDEMTCSCSRGGAVGAGADGVAALVR